MTEQKTRKLFEVVGENPHVLPSPYCWRTRMALAHKALRFVSEPWHAIEKDRIARSNGTTVPVLVDGEIWVRDSWDIATYLEDTYLETELFDGAAGRAKSLFLNVWADTILHPLIFRAVISEQFPLIADCDKPYYRERTLRKFGRTVDDLGAQPEISVDAVRTALAPVEMTLQSTAFFGGSAPDYADYILFGTFQWARVVSIHKFWDETDAMQRWFETLLDAFDGMGRKQMPAARSSF